MPAGFVSDSVGAWSMLGDPLVVATLATSGFDWVCLDAQHGAFDRASLVASLRGAREGWSPVMVRVPSPDGIGYSLDAGAAGVIVPMVNSAEDARRAIALSRYSPEGTRSWGPLGPLWGGAAPSATEANRDVTCAIMIETATALADLDAILDVPGVDAVFVGPYDLALALGVTLDDLLAGGGGELATISAACVARGITAGAFAGTVERAARLRELGFDCVASATDTGLLRDAAAAVLGASRGGSAGY